MLVNFDRNIHYVKGGRAKGLECGSKKWGKARHPGLRAIGPYLHRPA
jgi:hypothetical protein